MRRDILVAIVLMVTTLFAACAATTRTGVVARQACDAEVYGACVVYDPGVQHIPVSRLEAMFRTAAKHWDTEPEAIRGWTVVVKARDPFMFGTDLVWGITLFAVKRVDFALPAARCPEVVFVHEWGHAGANVLGHDDPRFESSAIWQRLAEAGADGCQS